MPKPFSSFGRCALHGEKESGAAWDRRDEGVTVQSCTCDWASGGMQRWARGRGGARGPATERARFRGWRGVGVSPCC